MSVPDHGAGVSSMDARQQLVSYDVCSAGFLDERQIIRTRYYTRFG